MYLKGYCQEDCAHIHMLPVYHLSLAAHNSHHGSYGRGIDEGQIDCRHYCANVIDTWNQVSAERNFPGRMCCAQYLQECCLM